MSSLDVCSALSAESCRRSFVAMACHPASLVRSHVCCNHRVLVGRKAASSRRTPKTLVIRRERIGEKLLKFV
jgi:hypothetical protein